MPDSRVLTILLADDDEDDRLLVQHAVKDSGLRADLHTVNDGAELLDYLRQRPTARPDLVLLDLNMPRMGGHEALREIKQDPDLRSIPVIVLTTSDDESDVTQVYEAHGNSYVVKPTGFSGLVDVMKSFSRYWGESVRLPTAA